MLLMLRRYRSVVMWHLLFFFLLCILLTYSSDEERISKNFLKNYASSAMSLDGYAIQRTDQPI